MPTYEYYCSQCHARFDIFQKISEAPLTECPHCKQASVKRVINGGSGMIFKGSGFYITDYKNKSDSKSNGKKTTEKKESSSSKESADKSDSGSS